MDHRPKLTLVRDCGALMGESAQRRNRRLRVKGLINPELPARDHLQLVGAPLGDSVAPLGDGAFGNVKGLGKRLRGAKVSDSGGLLHGDRSYSMLNLGVKDDKPGPGLSCLGMETMGSRIKQLRTAKGLTQTQLGELVGGLTKGAVSQWESGNIENIKLPTVLLLCEILGTDLPYLVYGPNRKPFSAFRQKTAAN